MEQWQDFWCRHAYQRGYNRWHINAYYYSPKMASKGTRVDGDIYVRDT